MRFILLAFCFCLVAIPLSYAEYKRPAASQPPDKRRVQLIEDQKLGAVRITIDGREAARIDAGGLHVRDSIEYSGTITDRPYAESSRSVNAP